MFKFFLYKLGLFFLNHFSIRTSHKFAAAISDIQYLFSFRDRKTVKRNLRNILPESNDISGQTREVFRNFGRYLVEFFKMNAMVDDQFIKDKVRINGIEHLDNALKKGKGGILVTAHIGNWELGAAVLSTLGYPLMAVALPHKERPVNDLFNQRREIKGITVVPTNTAFRQCIEQLKANKCVALVADRDFHAHGVVVDFLDRKMIVPKGPAVLAWKTGAPIIPVFLIRNGDGGFTLSCHEFIDPPMRDTSIAEDEAVLGIMRHYIPIIEDQVRAHPSQWLLFRDFAV